MTTTQTGPIVLGKHLETSLCVDVCDVFVKHCEHLGDRALYKKTLLLLIILLLLLLCNISWNGGYMFGGTVAELG